MQGAGNDFVVLDGTREPFEPSPAQIRKLADRRFGVGADQILMVERSTEAGIDFGYRIFNGGSGDEVEHCGNGARCFARFVAARGLSDKRTLHVATMNNTLELHLQDDGRVSVDMNAPMFALLDVPFDANGLRARWLGGIAGEPDTAFALWPLDVGEQIVEVAVLSMGNPHAVQIVADIDSAPVARLGAAVESHVRFARRVNAGFMQIVDRTHIRLRVYERGAGETLACGTGACAAVVAGIRLGLLDARVEVDARGGRLTIEWPGRAGPAGHVGHSKAHVSMTGPAETVFDGEIEL